MLLIDLTPFTTSVQEYSHVAMKIPCNEDGSPKLTILTGLIPELSSLDLGSPIGNGTVNGKYLHLSAEGKSCLYHAELPNGTTDIIEANRANKT